MPDGLLDLRILHNTERRNDGAEIMTTEVATPKPNKTPANSSDGPNPRKRTRTAPSGNKDEDDKKRGRGRPRLDADDKSAVERRRTQIRNAQRAYRDRKETTISSLEQQVADLVKTNEEMSNAFSAFHEFAANQGLLDISPELGAQLRIATDKFRALAQRASELGADDDGSREQSGSKSSSPDVISSKPQDAAAQKEQKTHGSVVGGGRTVRQQGLVTPPHYQSPPEIHSPRIEERQQEVEQQQQQQRPVPTFYDPINADNLEIITEPTYENASFPFVFTDAQLSSILGHHISPLGTAPSPTRSYSSSEATFGRRLQRFATECGLKLISSPNPPPLPLVRVFGFCLPFEPPDVICDRLRVCLQRPDTQSLNFWEYPFHNLGGTGTHFPPMPGPSVGNQGTMDVMRHGNDSGFAMGPFTNAIAESWGKLDARQRISVPGYEGDFYDAEDVEVYLRQKGVHISPRQDLLTIEVDLSLFQDQEATVEQQQHQQQQQPQQQPTQISPYTSTDGYTGMVCVENPEGFPTLTLPVAGEPAQPLLAGDGNPSVAVNSWNPGMLDQLTGNPETVSDGAVPGSYLLPGSRYFACADNRTSLPTAAAIYPVTKILPSRPGIPQFQPSSRIRTLVSLDVEVFIKKLTETTTCLGRTPGFRLENINKAFLAATIRV